MSIVDKIRKLSVSKGVSIAKVERDLQFSNNSISKWEKCSPSTYKLSKVADYFGVSMDYLIGKSNNSEHQEHEDISESINKTLESLMQKQNGMLFFEGKPLDDNTKKLLTISLENTIRLAKEMDSSNSQANK